MKREKTTVFFKKVTNYVRIGGTLFGYGEEMNSKEMADKACEKSVEAIVDRAAAGKICYDKSIVSSIIQQVDTEITKNNITENSEISRKHTYGQSLTVAVMITIQDEWEKKNSVYAKFECSKGIMRNYFDLVSKGAAKTKIFTSTMANTLSSAIHSGIICLLVMQKYAIV
jgi:hypothetical protein